MATILSPAIWSTGPRTPGSERAKNLKPDKHIRIQSFPNAFSVR